MPLPIIDKLDQKLVGTLNGLPLNLASGKMGICIYLYIKSKSTNNESYLKAANNLLDDIYNKINTVSSLGIREGLTGIALGLNYLVKNKYLEGDTNLILEDIDSIMFRKISFPEFSESLYLQELIDVLFYLYMRIKDQEKDSENDCLQKELAIEIVNKIYFKLNADLFNEPLTFTSYYTLPLLLYVFSKICELDFYNHKIIRSVEILSVKILTFIPLLNINKLYLYGGMKSFEKYIKDKKWGKHSALLLKETDFNSLLEDELQDKNIFLHDGYPFVYLLLSQLESYISDDKMSSVRAKILEKTERSQMWKFMENKSNYFLKYRGLYDGFCGTALFMDYLQKQKL